MMNEARGKKGKRRNFYQSLDLSPGATHNDILHAYSRAKNTYAGGSLASYTLMEDGDNSSIMEDIEEAFQILGNPAKRREYDIEMGFNTWADEPNFKPEDSSPADRLGTLKKVNKPMPQPMVEQGPAPISSVAASIASIGDMSFEGATLPSATVIPMKPNQVSASMTPSMNGQFGTSQTTLSKAAPMLHSSQNSMSSPSGGSVSGSVGGVDFEPNLDFEKRISTATEIDGAFLKAVRIYRRYTPESLAMRCKLSTSHILTLENEDASNMHQPVYLRGHVYLVCQALDLPNPDRLAKCFVDKMAGLGKFPKKMF